MRQTHLEKPREEWTDDDVWANFIQNLDRDE